jgi:hypothetical protein
MPKPEIYDSGGKRSPTMLLVYIYKGNNIKVGDVGVILG